VITFSAPAQKVGSASKTPGSILGLHQQITRPMLGVKSFWSARITIAGIEAMHMIERGQMDCPEGQTMSAANQFYSLVA
jgi:hypothetical protein